MDINNLKKDNDTLKNKILSIKKENNNLEDNIN